MEWAINLEGQQNEAKISTQLATGFALIVLITVLLIGAVANGLINRQFERYVALQRKKFFGTAGRITAIPV